MKNPSFAVSSRDSTHTRKLPPTYIGVEIADIVGVMKVESKSGLCWNRADYQIVEIGTILYIDFTVCRNLECSHSLIVGVVCMSHHRNSTGDCEEIK